MYFCLCQAAWRFGCSKSPRRLLPLSDALCCSVCVCVPLVCLVIAAHWGPQFQGASRLMLPSTQVGPSASSTDKHTATGVAVQHGVCVCLGLYVWLLCTPISCLQDWLTALLLCSSSTLQCCCVAGNSGGPLLDSSGRLIGVASVEYIDKQYMHCTHMACLWTGPESHAGCCVSCCAEHCHIHTHRHQCWCGLCHPYRHGECMPSCFVCKLWQGRSNDTGC